jgi:AbrB family looped-hinge helix DNA binding protein
MQEIKTTISKEGRIIIPSLFRKELGLNEGDELYISLSDQNEIKIKTVKHKILSAQKIASKYFREDDSTVEDFLKFRKDDQGN